MWLAVGQRVSLRRTQVLLDQGVVRQSHPAVSDLGLSSLQDQLTDRLQVGEPVGGGEVRGGGANSRPRLLLDPGLQLAAC